MGKTELQASLNAMDIWVVIFGILIAIGSVGVSVVGFVHWRRSNQLQVILEAENLAQKNDISQANARALEAQLALEKFKAPRSLTREQIAEIARRMSPFKGLRAVLGAVPPSGKNTAFLNLILAALKSAEVDAFINLNGVEASVSPTGASNRGQMLTEGFPNGVSIFFVTGNDRGKVFALALAEALNDADVVATATGDWRESWVVFRMKEDGTNRNSKDFEPVTIVVGDKP